MRNAVKNSHRVENSAEKQRMSFLQGAFFNAVGAAAKDFAAGFNHYFNRHRIATLGAITTGGMVASACGVGAVANHYNLFGIGLPAAVKTGGAIGALSALFTSTLAVASVATVAVGAVQCWHKGREIRQGNDMQDALAKNRARWGLLFAEGPKGIH